MARGETYDEFVEKFKPKKTTDDCYTPKDVYDVVLDWASDRYGFDKSAAVRPFWPGGDYESFDYPEGCVVVDNPPFSCLTKIIKHYKERDIRFFLFAPALTAPIAHASIVMPGTEIVYENGAIVATAFATNLDDFLICTAPDLSDAIKDANKAEVNKKKVSKIKYPRNVLTPAIFNGVAKTGAEVVVYRDEAERITRLDAQVGTKKSIFGTAYLISDRKALEIERVKIDALNTIEYQLSDSERAIIAGLR